MAHMSFGRDIGLAPNADEGDNLDVRALWFVIQRRLPVILIVLCTIFGLTIAITLQMREVYTANARILIDPRERNIIDAGFGSGMEPDSAITETEVQLILSRRILNEVARELDLVKDPEFNPQLRPETFPSLIKSRILNFGRAPQSGVSEAQAEIAPQTEDDGTTSALTDAETSLAETLTTDSLQGSVRAWREGLTFMIQVTATSEDPAKAARIVNAIVDHYINHQVDSKRGDTQNASVSLTGRIDVLKEQVRAAESAVEDFRNAKGLGQAGGVSATEAKIASLSSQLLILEADLVEKESRLEEARRSFLGQAGTSGDFIQSPSLNTLRLERAALARKLADISAVYDQLHPTRTRVVEELSQLDGAIQLERRRLVSLLESDAQVARNTVNAVRSSLAGLTAKLEQSNVDMIRQRELEREAAAMREQYEQLLSRSAQVSQAVDFQRADASVVSLAEIPNRPSAPNHLLNVIFGGLAAVALAALSALILELFETGFVSADDIERTVSIPVVATIPQVKGRNPFRAPSIREILKYRFDKPFSAYGEANRNLLRAILRETQPETGRVVALTSSLPGEGKTTVSLSIAHLAAELGKKVVLVDGDIHKRSLTLTISPTTERGFLEAVAGHALLTDVLIRPEGQGFDFLPAAVIPETRTELLPADRLEALLTELRERYDLIIVDSPPVLPVLEARTICSTVDMVIFACRWRHTQTKAVLRALRQLASDNIRVHHIAITRANLRKLAMFEHFSGAHYKQYTAYYKN